MSEQITKEQIAAYELEQQQAFARAYELLVKESGYMVVPVVEIVDGRITARLEIRKQQ